MSVFLVLQCHTTLSKELSPTHTQINTHEHAHTHTRQYTSPLQKHKHFVVLCSIVIHPQAVTFYFHTLSLSLSLLTRPLRAGSVNCRTWPCTQIFIVVFKISVFICSYSMVTFISPFIRYISEDEFLPLFFVDHLLLLFVK